MRLFTVLWFMLFLLTGVLKAQDYLEKLLLLESKPSKDPVKATFKSTRVINGHSVETMAAKHLDFRISHRFGEIKDVDNFFGLDMAKIRLGLEYGITDRLMIGIGRSSHRKELDGFIKYKALQQNEDGSMPVSVVLLGASTLRTEERRFSNPNFDWQLENGMAYISQVLIARKFSSSFSLQLSPTVVHRNVVLRKDDQNMVLACGIGGRYKLTKRVSFNAEYFYQLPGENAKRYTNALSFGFDIETGGHVFQLHLTNSPNMNERGFITENTGTWGDGNIFYGFNISRTFSFDNQAKGKTW